MISLPTYISQLAGIIAEALITNACDPTEEHTDARGKNWGHVEMWPINDQGHSVVRVSTNGSGVCHLCEDAQDDLASWLLGDEADAVDICNARDQEPDDLSDDFTGACRIIRRRDYNGPTTHYAWVETGGGNPEPAEYDSYEDTEAAVEDLESGTYHLAHNESGAPTYYIVEA